MVKVIAIANQKGRRGQRPPRRDNLGAAMAAAGKRVLLIDLDSQASLTISVGLEPLEVERTIVDVLRKDGTPLMECVQQLSDRAAHCHLDHRPGAHGDGAALQSQPGEDLRPGAPGGQGAV